MHCPSVAGSKKDSTTDWTPHHHPIHQLPLEILGHVFHMGALENPSSFPTLVSHVSSLWRDIALSKPYLWSYIDFNGKDLLVKAKLWLQRSRKRPLRIILSVHEGFPSELEDVKEAIGFVKPLIHRWGSLVLHLDPEPLQLAMELCDQAAPALTHLSISCTEQDVIDEAIPIFGEKTPMLKSLRLESVPLHWGGSLFAGLTTLELRSYNEDTAPALEQVIDILRRCIGIQRLVLEEVITGTQTNCVWNLEGLVLRDLEYMHLARLDRDLKLWFIIKVFAPKAHTFIGDPEKHDPEFTDILHREYKRTPFPGLRLFRMEYANPPVDTFRSMLRDMTLLRRIEFYHCDVPDEVLTPLVWTPESLSGPSLRELHFEASGGFSVELLRTVIASRLQDGAARCRVESLVIRDCCSSICPKDEDLVWFQHNVPVFDWKQ